ncbi:hypothetical protein [Desulfovibrio desulfuricans]|uniref:hypothetical protein n=1 Tax=Desulfovibrio desulfuricans TaxID=876 RepID=UPI001AE8D928|nr:hypothetical protein [Desulfovibrio desulfuricans]QTO41176.1 hypothetical protein J8J02_04540 [Desulfovibrio desulfuricans]
MKIPFALSVGVTGHRSLSSSNISFIKDNVGKVLSTISDASIQIVSRHQEIFTDTPLLNINSCLSEGADRLVAREGLGLGFNLGAILPFNRYSSIHGHDLPASDQELSRNELNSLLKESTSVFEISSDIGAFASDASGEELRQNTYLSASISMLKHSDIVLVLWNKKSQQRSGSTYDVLNRSLNMNKIVILIETENNSAPCRCSLIDKNIAYSAFNNDLSDLKNLIINNFLPPHADHCQQLERLKECLNDLDSPDKDIPYIATLWNKFYKLITRLDGPIGQHDNPSPRPEVLSNYYNKFSQLSNYYSQCYRSFFLFSPILSTLAVSVAVITLSLPETYTFLKTLCGISEIFLISTLLFSHKISEKLKWKEKFTNYRLMTEVLRHSMAIHSLGTCLSLEESGVVYENRNRQWVYWFAHNILRIQGIPNYYWNSDIVEHHRLIKSWLREQKEYHIYNAARSKKAQHFFHSLTNFLVVLTVVFVLAHVIFEAFHIHFIPKLAYSTINLGTILFPLWAMCFHAVCQYAELRRLEDRSTYMSEKLLSFEKSFMKDISCQNILDTADIAAHLMLSEVIEWNIQYKMPEVSKA